MLDTTRLKYETIVDLKRLNFVIDEAWLSGLVCVDSETSGLDSQQCDLVGVCLSVRPGTGVYVPLGHSTGEPQISLQAAIAHLKPLLEHPMITKVLLNAKFDMAVFHRYGIDLSPVEDVMLMSNSMFGGSGRHGMDYLSERWLRYAPIKFAEVVGSGANQLTFDAVPIDRACQYASEDADITLRLFDVMSGKLRNDPDGRHVYETLERPLINVIARMERFGIVANHSYLSELTAQFTASAERCLDEAYGLAGVEFNLASPRQVGEVLRRMGVGLTETTETGQIATGVEVLQDVLENGQLPENGAAELIAAILEYRKFTKLIGTYTDALPKRINPNTGRIHPSYGMASTTTGRLACSEPNLQNIPVRTAEGKLLRKAFIAPPKHKLISADYSQIELRVLAHATGDEALFRAFETGLDIHQMTASEVWGIPFEEVSKDKRRDAKAVNFGIIYGQSAYGLSRGLKISVDEAERIIRDYFARFKSIESYMERARAAARKTGYVTTIAGRKVWAPDINSGSRARRRYAERAVVNAPIQGTAADVIKEAMIKVDAWLQQEELRTRLLLQVHDELVFEAPDDEVDYVLTGAKQIMESVAEYIDVPLVVDANAGDNWQEAH